MNENPVVDNVKSDVSTAATSPVQAVHDGRAVLNDPGAAALRRYLPVLAVIAAPYVDMAGKQDPLTPLDRVAEWDLMRAVLDDATREAGAEGAPLALVRLSPPTSSQLAGALAHGGPDAFRVLHVVGHGERDMLYLEDEDGRESYAVAEHVANLVKPSGLCAVVLEGCFSEHMAKLLVEQTGVQVVIGTRRRVLPENARVFGAGFYAALAQGASIRRAYRGALAALKGRANGQAERYEFVEKDALDDLDDPAIPLPPAEDRASCPLVVDGDPPLVNLPRFAGFTGRRDLLAALADSLADSGPRLIAFEAEPGLGKTTLAAEVAGRFAWRYPGGVLWVHVTPQTTAREIAAGVAQLAGRSPYTPDADLPAALAPAPALIVLDQVDQIAAAERSALRPLLARLTTEGEARVLLTARRLDDLLPSEPQQQVYALERLPPKTARMLAMQLAVTRGVEALDVDTIDDFLDRTMHLPWMIDRGVALAAADGLPAALAELATYKPDMPEPLALYLRRRITLLATELDNPAGLLARAQHLPDAFDRALAGVLVGSPERAEAHVEALLRYSLLRAEGDWVALPPTVRAQVAQLTPLDGAKADQVDSYIMRHLVSAWAAAPEAEGLPPLTREEQARLNNTRAVIGRQIRPGSTLPRAMVARLLITAASAYRRAGLAEEFWRSAQPVRETLGEGVDYARLQIAMGEALSCLPDRRDEAGYLLQMSQALSGVDRNVLATASRAYGEHLRAAGELDAAEETLGAALKALLTGKGASVRVAAGLAHGWAGVLVAQKRLKTALTRYEAALAGYRQAGMTGRVQEVQRDLGETLLRLGQVDRADAVLAEALADPCGIERPALRGQIRYRQALADLVRAARAHKAGQLAERDAAWNAAERDLRAALPDLLAGGAADELAQVYHELGRLLARRGRVDEATAHVQRSRVMVERAGQQDELATVLLTLGKLYVAAEQLEEALPYIHRALALATGVRDTALAGQAAELIVRAHQIVAREVDATDDHRREGALALLDQSRAALEGARQERYLAALESVRRAVAGG